MRVEITLPDDKKFKDKLQALSDADNRSRKNWMETIIIQAVNSTLKPVIKEYKRKNDLYKNK